MIHYVHYTKYEANFAFSFDLNLHVESLFKLIEAHIKNIIQFSSESDHNATSFACEDDRLRNLVLL
jgi:hypothetical protein